MKIGIGNDHVAVEYKKEIKKSFIYISKQRKPAAGRLHRIAGTVKKRQAGGQGHVPGSEKYVV